MSLTAGTLSQVSVSSNSAVIGATAATGGTGPYTQQLYMSTTTGFSPGAGSLIAGATSLTNTVSGLNPNVVYFFKMVYTDTGNSNITVTSSQLSVTSTPTQLSQNQFTLSQIGGSLDQHFNYNSHSAQVDVSQSGSLYAGQPVKRITTQTSTNGIPKVVGCTADNDLVWGYINYDIKTIAFSALAMCEVSMSGNVMYIYSTGAINPGAQVCLDTLNGGVVAATGSSAKRIVGWAYDGAAASGQLIRVYLTLPSFTLDS